MKKIISILIFTLVLTSVSFADKITRTYYFDEPLLTPDSIYTRIEITDGVVVGTPGYPALPYRGISLLLPQNENITDVLIEKGNEIDLGEHIVYPIQRPVPISDTSGYEFTEPDPDIYESSEPFPAQQNTDFSTHYLAGYSIGSIAITPFSYIPATGELSYFESITITVETDYNEAAETAADKFLFKNNPAIDPRLPILVENYEDKDIFYNPTRTRPDSAYDYIIVTSADYEDDFQPLADFHTQQGYRTKIEIIGDILSSYDGVDNADKLRNYFKAEYTQNPFQYVLLGGDTDIIPHRGLYVNATAGGEVDYDIPADMYYACLDRTSAPGDGPDWNNDNDDKWGEPNEADLLAEFYIGRICINNSSEIANFINKTTMYSETPVEDNLQSALMLGEQLDWWTYGGWYMDELIGTCSSNFYTTTGIPIYWNISKLYDENFWWTDQDLFNGMNQGPNLLNHIGHSNVQYCMRIYNSDLTTSNITNNGVNANFINGYTQGCYAGSFDNRKPNGSYTGDAFAEKITTMETATVTFIANSRYGWGRRNSTNGASQRFHRYWVDTFFDDGIYSIGGANQLSKEKAIPFIESQAVSRWCCYELNVFGDPIVQLWTDSPEFISASYNDVLFIGQNSFWITDANCNEGLVAIHFNNEIIAKGDLEDGMVELEIFNPPAATGTATLSILSHNYYFYQDALPVIPFTYAVINPDTIPINQQVEVKVTVFQDPMKGMPLPDVYVEAYGPGVFGDTLLGVTDKNGVCVLNFGAEYGGDNVVRIRGWKSEAVAGYYLFDESISVTDGLALTNPDLTVTTEVGLVDTFALDHLGILHSVVEEDNCMLWARINNSEWQNTMDDSMEIIPEVPGRVTGMITKSGYNIYQEEFQIKKAYGNVSGIVTDSTGNCIDKAKISIYTLEDTLEEEPLVTTYTDESGEYDIVDMLPVGDYQFVGEKFNYRRYEEIHLVQCGENVINIELESAATDTVYGIILYEENDPGIATVEVYRNDNGDLVDSLECSSGDGMGIFSIALVSYTYLFSIEASGYEVLDTVVVIENDTTIVFTPDPHDYVKEVPDEYLTIQAAIDSCVDGDTVLVSPGTYYENIKYKGKNITVGSLFLTTQDTSYISHTIINGNEAGSVVTFSNREDTTAILTGFTITQGSGKLIESDGKLISYGGGIYCARGSSATLSHLIVKGNTAQWGAGIWVDHVDYDDQPILIKNCLITENHATSENGKGGGVAIHNHPANLINCTVANNSSDDIAGAIYGYGNEINLVNCIGWGNTQSQDTHCFFANATVSISYSDIEDGESGIELQNSTLIWGEGNIDADPLFTAPDNGDYSLQWNSENFSPCIDTGDPNTEWDADGTPPDMGAIPTIEHRYDKWELPPITVDNGWKWISFPTLDTLYDEGDVAGYMLEDILDPYILHHVIWKPLGGGEIEYIQYDNESGDWFNLGHIFTSPQGYKFKMSESLQEPVYLEISGFLEDPATEIPLIGGGEENWIGYFIDMTQKVETAFGESMDNIYLIQTQHWTMARTSPKQEAPWIPQHIARTLSYGDMVIVKCFEDEMFKWTSFGCHPAYEREKTEYFTYTEQADYIPIFVEFEPDDLPDEVGVFVDDTCKGASVVEDTLIDICAYVLDNPDAELTFELYYGGKSSSKKVKEYFVYNPITMQGEKGPIIFDGSREYYLVSFREDGGITLPREYSISNFPNPFFHNTTIQYALPEDAEISISIYNIKGQLVKRIVKGEQSPGIYDVIWDGKDEKGKNVSNGIYFCQLKTENKTILKKMLLLR